MSRKPANRRVTPLLLIFFGMFLILGAVVVYNDLPGSSTVSVTPTQIANRIPYPNIARISLDEAKQAWDQSSAIFVDTRGSQYYSQGHIAGALSIPEDELLTKLNQLSKDDFIITYCT